MFKHNLPFENVKSARLTGNQELDGLKKKQENEQASSDTAAQPAADNIEADKDGEKQSGASEINVQQKHAVKTFKSN